MHKSIVLVVSMSFKDQLRLVRETHNSNEKLQRACDDNGNSIACFVKV